MSKRGKTAAELMAELQSDPKFRQREMEATMTDEFDSSAQRAMPVELHRERGQTVI
jgi:hypothetical protein